MSPIAAFIICWLIFLIPFFEYSFLQKNGLKIRVNFIGYNVLFFLATIFLALNTNNADYSTYEYVYKTNGTATGFESNMIFGLLCKLFYSNGIEYQTFRVVAILFGLFSVYHFIKKESTKPLFIFVLYLISSYVMDGIQFRQFMAMGVFLLALPALMSEDKKGTFIYIVGITIASAIHLSFAFFYLMLLIKVERKKRIKIAFGILVIFFGLFFILQKSGMLLDVLGYFIPDNKVALYVTGDKYHNDTTAVLRFIVTQSLPLIGLLILFKKFNFYNKMDLNFINTVIGIDLLMLCLCPMFFYSLQFRRILRVVFLPSYIALEKMLPSELKSTKFFMIVLMIVFSLISWYWNITNNTDLLSNLFQNNLLY